MTAALFTVLTHGALLLAGCTAFVVWAFAGFPTFTITTKG